MNHPDKPPNATDEAFGSPPFSGQGGPEKSSFSASSLQTLIVRMTVLVANLLTGIVMARWLGPELLGVYYLLAILPVMAFRFGNLGFGTALSFFAAKGLASGREFHRLAWAGGLVMAIASAIGLGLVRERSFSPWRDLDAHLFYLFLISVPLEFWILYGQRVLIGKLRITQVNISAIIRGYGGVAFVVMLVAVAGLGVRGALLAVVGAMFATCLYLFGQTRRVSRQGSDPARPRGTRSLIVEMWRYGRWTYLMHLSRYLCVQLPLLVMARFAPSEAVAFYGVARALIQKTELLAMPFSTMLLPFTAAAEERDAVRRTNMLCRVFIWIMLALVAVLIVAVGFLIPLLYGEAYLPAVGVFWAASPGIVFLPLSLFLGLHVVGSGKPREVFFADLGVLLVAAAACGVLIPAHGAVGAGWCYSIITAASFALRMVVYRRNTGAALADILVPRREDWTHCGRALGSFLKRLRGRRDAGGEGR
jgi:O-antigen/teichoic acid export membrane protein